MTSNEPFISSVRIEPGRGSHEYVTVWIRGANVGTLCVGKGDGAQLALLLSGSGARPLRQPAPEVFVAEGTPEEQLAALERKIAVQHSLARRLEATGKADMERFAERLQRRPLDGIPFVMKGPLAGAPRLRPEGPWSTHQPEYTTAEAGPGAPAPSAEDASKAELESRPLGVPPAAGAPPTSDPGTEGPGYPRTEVR